MACDMGGDIENDVRGTIDGEVDGEVEWITKSVKGITNVGQRCN